MAKKKPKKTAAKKRVAVKRNKHGGFIVGKKPLLPKGRRVMPRRVAPVQVEIPEEIEPVTVTETDLDYGKLTLKTLIGKRIGKIEGPTYLFDLFGVAESQRVGRSNWADYIALQGKFQAKTYPFRMDRRGDQLILPLEIIGHICELAKGQGFPVEFAFRVIARPSGNLQGFEYELEHHLPTRHVDLLGRLIESAKINGKVAELFE